LPRGGFEQTIPVSERSKTVRALDEAPIGTHIHLFPLYDVFLIVTNTQYQQQRFITRSPNEKLTYISLTDTTKETLVEVLKILNRLHILSVVELVQLCCTLLTAIKAKSHSELFIYDSIIRITASFMLCGNVTCVPI
jgi:hypothetical protein